MISVYVASAPIERRRPRSGSGAARRAARGPKLFAGSVPKFRQVDVGAPRERNERTLVAQHPESLSYGAGLQELEPRDGGPQVDPVQSRQVPRLHRQSKSGDHADVARYLSYSAPKAPSRCGSS